MPRGKTIKLFLIDGEPSGRIKCSLTNWTGIAYKIPRTALDKCKDLDIKVLTDDLAKREADLRRIENTQSENHYLIHELNSIKKRLLSFEEFAKDAQPETLFTLVHSIVDRIYITTDGSTQKCQVYIKGCATEDYSDILGAAEYIDGKFLLPVATYMPPMCDLDKYSIGYKI